MMWTMLLDFTWVTTLQNKKHTGREKRRTKRMGKKEVKKKSLIIKTESKVGRSPKQKRKVAETEKE